MRKRGRVLRVPGETPGLLMVEGQQFRFSTEVTWSSPVVPTPGLMVDVDMDSDSQVLGIAPITDPQLSKEKAETGDSRIKNRTIQIIRSAGYANLGAAAVLIVASCFLTNVSVQMPLVGRLDFTFWQVLGLLNTRSALQAIDLRSGKDSVGYYGCLALIALSGPFLYRVWRDRLALIGGLAPLIFLIIIWVMARSMMQNAFAGNFGATYPDIGRDSQREMSGIISLGIGAYLSVLASLYFGIVAAQQFLSRQSASGDSHTRSNAANA